MVLHRAFSQRFLKLSSILSLALVLLLSASALSARQVTLTILFTNDHHGQLEPCEDGWGGVARRATAIAAVRQEVGASKVVLVAAGDVFMGGALSPLTRGAADAAAYQAMGYDAIAVGNHDLDHGQGRLRELRTRYKTPWISANVLQGGSHNLVRPYEFKYAGLRVGLVGLSNPSSSALTKKENVRGLKFNDPVGVAGSFRTILKKTSDVVVVLSHLGSDADKELARKANFVHVIVGGHTHEAYPEAVKTKKPDGTPGPLIVQAGERGRYLGRLDLTLSGDKKNGYKVVSHQYRLIPLSPEVAPDPAMEKLLEGFKSQSGVDLDEKVCDVSKDSNRPPKGDWPLACLTADAMREAAGADVAVLNAGSFRADLKGGTLTKGALMALMPFEDKVVSVGLNGAELRRVLERSWAKQGQGSFLHLSNLSVAGKGGALEIMVGDQPLEAQREYKVATNDFLASGGDGYEVFARAKTREKTEIDVQGLLEKRLRSLGKVPERVEAKRWRD